MWTIHAGARKPSAASESQFSSNAGQHSCSTDMLTRWPVSTAAWICESIISRQRKSRCFDCAHDDNLILSSQNATFKYVKESPHLTESPHSHGLSCACRMARLS